MTQFKIMIGAEQPIAAAESMKVEPLTLLALRAKLPTTTSCEDDAAACRWSTEN
jgi:hypothetical protein